MGSTAILVSNLGRSDAVLTNAEVDGETFDLTDLWGGFISVDLSFTLGSLTNCIVRFKASTDGVTFDPIWFNGSLQTETLTADAERCYVLPCIPGMNYFTCSVEGSGTVTSSTCAFTYRYFRRGSQ